jgi:ribonuclease HIII
MRNLNRLLAWGHARVIDNLIGGNAGRPGISVDGVVADQFGDERYIRNALKSMNGINLIQRPRGESNMAVAAASILARDGFVRRVDELREKYQMDFPLGAGPRVTQFAREFANRHGRDALSDVAKIHFKTSKEI